MTRPKFSMQEFAPTGKFYPRVPLPLSLFGVEPPAQPVLNRPISSKENWKLLFEGKRPYWIPFWGLFGSDIHQFRPRINPDNVANHQVIDGGPFYSFENHGNVIRSNWFDLDWVWNDDIFGATVRPGAPKIPDIECWEDYVSMPDVDAMDWETCAQQNVEYLSSDKMNQLGIQCGLWERLMAVCDVEGACIALLDEDQKEGVHRFLDQYTNVLIKYIGHTKEVCNIDSVQIHQDWAHQRGPFASPDTFREMLLPYMKRIVDYVHSLGMYYEVHSCGNVEMLIPLFIESGADMWGGQENLNDIGAYAKKYKDSPFVFAVPAPIMDPSAPEEEVRKVAKAWVDEYKDCNVAIRTMNEIGPTHPLMLNYIYEYSRIAYQDEA